MNAEIEPTKKSASEYTEEIFEICADGEWQGTARDLRRSPREETGAD
jgi:hypothetical protein